MPFEVYCREVRSHRMDYERMQMMLTTKRKARFAERELPQLSRTRNSNPVAK